MKKAAILGGIGPESTIDYYRGIIEAFRDSYQQIGYPEILIDSLNLKEVISMAEKNMWDDLASLMASHFESLRTCGADFGVIASNTPHKVFEKIQQKTRLRLISITSETCEHVLRKNLKKICLLGTKFTMESDFYQSELAKNGIETVVPDTDEIDYIQQKLFTEIEHGIIIEETKKELLKILNRIEAQHKTEGVILGCTELPLIIKREDIPGEYINTTEIHIKAVVRNIRGN